MLTNIWKVKNSSKIHCNARFTCSVLEGNFGSITARQSIVPTKLPHWWRDHGVQAKPSRTPLPWHVWCKQQHWANAREYGEGEFWRTLAPRSPSREAWRIQGMIANPTKRDLLGLCMKNYWPIAMLPCETLTTLTEFLVLTLLTLGGKRLGQNLNAFGKMFNSWLTMLLRITIIKSTELFPMSIQIVQCLPMLYNKKQQQSRSVMPMSERGVR